MTKDEINVLTLSKFYQIYSESTKRLYIDKDFRCYLFEAEREAKQFCEKIEGIYYDKDSSSYIKQGPFVSLCYGLGIDTIRVKSVKREKYVDIKVSIKDARHQFYNSETEKNILRLKQTKKRKYLIELASSFFISPVMIDKREEGQYPVIHYSYAMLPGGNIYYLLFTTLQEFDKWNDTQNKIYCPNKTNLQDLNRVRGNNPVLINPSSDQLILTDKQIVSITKRENM